MLRRVSLDGADRNIFAWIAGIRGKTLIINLPEKPGSIGPVCAPSFPRPPYCLDLIGAGRIETGETVVRRLQVSRGEAWFFVCLFTDDWSALRYPRRARGDQRIGP